MIGWYEATALSICGDVPPSDPVTELTTLAPESARPELPLELFEHASRTHMGTRIGARRMRSA